MVCSRARSIKIEQFLKIEILLSKKCTHRQYFEIVGEMLILEQDGRTIELDSCMDAENECIAIEDTDHTIRSGYLLRKMNIFPQKDQIF